MTFEIEYNKIKDTAQKELEFIEKYMIQCIDVRDELKSHIINFLKAPSKRVRPLLSILFYKSLYGEINENQLKALGAVELIHSASLIHDDIIDKSDIRRGLKTTASEFGNKLGVICGDYLLSIAMNIVTELGSIGLLQNFSDTLKKMCIGEINQNFDRFKIGTIEEYIEKSKNKTAYLFQTAMLTPFIIGRIQDNQLAAKFGLNIGISFQIRDDLVNVLNTDLSKPSENDISDGIYNAPVIYAGNIERYSDGVEKTRCLLNNYINEAKNSLKMLPNNIYKESLEKFSELLGND
jgi:geranylgeranyl pyrophosphate synthase